jgi:hypothetical protein
MTKFDFISVLVSIVFGLGLTHICGLPFVGQNAACAVVIHRVTSRQVRRAVAWWLLLTIVLWALFVRRHLGQ